MLQYNAEASTFPPFLQKTPSVTHHVILLIITVNMIFFIIQQQIWFLLREYLHLVSLYYFITKQKAQL